MSTLYAEYFESYIVHAVNCPFWINPHFLPACVSCPLPFCSLSVSVFPSVSLAHIIRPGNYNRMARLDKKLLVLQKLLFFSSQGHKQPTGEFNVIQPMQTGSGPHDLWVDNLARYALVQFTRTTVYLEGRTRTSRERQKRQSRREGKPSVAKEQMRHAHRYRLRSP